MEVPMGRWGWVLGLAVGCNKIVCGAGTHEEGGTCVADTPDTDVDTDPDTDPDTTETGDTNETGGDSGGDTGGDTGIDTGIDTGDPPTGDFTGTLNYQYVTDADGVVCDVDYALVGETFTGSCSGCDYAFEITARVTEDRGTSDCVVDPVLTFTENAVIQDPVLAHFDSYYGTYYLYYDVLANGVSLDYSAYGYGFYAGPYWQALSFDGSTTSTYSRSGSKITWNYADDGSLGWQGWGYEVCATLETPPTDASGVEIADSVDKATTQTINETLACDVSSVDVYGFTGTGKTVRISADNTSRATAMDLWLIVVADDTCIGWYADDSLTCAYAPADGYQCPAIEIDTDSGAAYEVMVLTYEGCGSSMTTTGSGDYVFGIDGATASLVTDDLGVGYARSVTMTGTIR